MVYDYTIIGGGIVGLSVGKAISETYPGTKILVIEKESTLASHQTGNNSGVIHSGIYYEPGSLKAQFAKRGRQSIVEFCRNHSIEHEVCGKVIVATCENERPLLHHLYERGLKNGLDIKKLNRKQLLEVEPHVNGVEAIYVSDAGIVNYKQVSEAFANIIRNYGGDIYCSEEVINIDERPNEVVVETNRSTYHSSFLINCAGLQSDRVAKMTGYYTDLKIVPFRGEYYQLIQEKRDLVRHLIYPVPNPDFPFLGAHFTRMINGEVEAGPNAVLSFKREGYKKTDLHLKDLIEVLSYPGFIKLAARNMKFGLSEMIRSFSKQAFVKSLQQLIPEVNSDDLVPSPAGVRAQALNRDGELIDDFQIIQGKKSLHVCNAPSPAATASIEIGEAIVTRI